MNKENAPTNEPAFNPAAFRRERVGVLPLTIEDGETIYIEVKSKNVEQFPSTKHGDIDFVKAVNLQTGEEGHFWLSGQLRHQMNEIAKANKLAGAKFEIIHKGKKKVQITDKETGKTSEESVNQYDMFLLQ